MPRYRRKVFVVEQAGMVRIANGNGRTRSAPFLDMRGLVRFDAANPVDEQGLLSIEFDRGFRHSHRFFVFYVNRSGAIQIDSYRAAERPLRARPETRTWVMAIPHPGSVFHHGGQLQIGPDGMLWTAIGDGGHGDDPFDNARDVTTRLGKLLRFRPGKNGGYSIPDSNPFKGGGGIGAHGAIWSLGLRNPWRFSFDRRDGRLLIADVGRHQREEVNYVDREQAKGADFGWPKWEGTRLNDPSRPGPGLGPLIDPIHESKRPGGRGAITGGYIVRDKTLRSLYGRYLYADFYDSRLRSLIPRKRVAKDDRALGPKVEFVSSFGQGNKGAIFVASHNGPVYRLRAR